MWPKTSNAAMTRQVQARGSWIPWLFVAFLLAVVAANGMMIWIAVESWPGLVTSQAYDKGLIYNRNLEAAQRQASLGWQPHLTARILEGFAAEVELVLTNMQGEPLTRAEVHTVFKRPVQDGADFELVLGSKRPGIYRAGFELPMIGLWDIHVTIRRDGDLFVHDERVMLR